jgi:hypothetical protein
MTLASSSDKFTRETLDNLFPNDRADRFFEALFGDISDGAYDISLEFVEEDKNSLFFEFHLKQRPGKCLACNLTYGLPEVFTRHPIINIKGIVQEIDKILGGQDRCTGWKLGATREVSRTLHVIPFIISLKN